MLIRSITSIVALALVLAACGVESEPSATGSEAASGTTSAESGDGGTVAAPSSTTSTTVDREERTVETTPQPVSPEPVPTTGPTGVTGEAPADLIAAVIADLAERTGADTAKVTVAVDEFVIWNDGSLGCPQPGQMYTQALVEGYRIVLAYAGAQYDYHASQRGYFVLCEGVRGSGTVPPPGEPTS